MNEVMLLAIWGGMAVFNPHRRNFTLGSLETF